MNNYNALKLLHNCCFTDENCASKQVQCLLSEEFEHERCLILCVNPNKFWINIIRLLPVHVFFSSKKYAVCSNISAVQPFTYIQEFL